MRFLNETHKKNYETLRKKLGVSTSKEYTTPIFIMAGSEELFSNQHLFIDEENKEFIIDILKDANGEKYPSFNKAYLSSSGRCLTSLMMQFYNNCYEDMNIITIMNKLDSTNRRLCISALEYYFNMGF